MLYLSYLLSILVIYLIIYIHFYFVHLKILIEISGCSGDKKGYLLNYGPFCSNHGISLFFSLTIACIILVAILLLPFVFIDSLKKYNLIGSALILIFALTICGYNVAELIFIQKTGTWAFLDHIIVGLLGYRK